MFLNLKRFKTKAHERGIFSNPLPFVLMHMITYYFFTCNGSVHFQIFHQLQQVETQYNLFWICVVVTLSSLMDQLD